MSLPTTCLIGLLAGVVCAPSAARAEPSDIADLVQLSLSEGVLTPVFQLQNPEYRASLGYVKPPNTAQGQSFGYSVAIDGDTMVVGSFSEDSNATGVHPAPLPGSGDETPSIGPEQTTSGTMHDDSASHSGAVYLFRRRGAEPG